MALKVVFARGDLIEIGCSGKVYFVLSSLSL